MAYDRIFSASYSSSRNVQRDNDRHMRLKGVKLFPAIREERVNPALIEYSYKQHIINDWERNFLFGTYRKRVFRGKQLPKFKSIKAKIFDKIRQVVSRDARNGGVEHAF